MTKAKPKSKHHAPSSPYYDERADYDGRSFWTREEVLEMDSKFKAAMFDSEEWKARLRATAED